MDYSDIFHPNTFTVAMVWKMYASIVLPKDVSRIQHDETRKAFYAGFLEGFKVMTDYAANLSEDDACLLFNRLMTEGTAFYDEMVKAHGQPGKQ